ncbi:hypothetical protein CS8_012860 [Cupriavidus sp. 8B]
MNASTFQNGDARRKIAWKALAIIVCSALLLAIDLLATPQIVAAEVVSPSPELADIKPEIVWIPVPGAGTFGGEIKMRTEVYKPAGTGPFPTLIFSHGRSPDRVERGKLENPILRGHVRYWLAKGIAIVAPVRIGYGETGGPDRENAGASFDTLGNCTRKPDYRNLAKVTREVTLAAITWTREQTWADKSRLILEGRSVGGFATVATAAARPPGVIAYINFSGGAGGSPDLAPGRSCDAEQMAEVMGEMGKSATIPGLWLYAKNDFFWGATAPTAWHAAFASGGSPTRFISTGEVVGRDGHLLLSYGGKLWSVHVDQFVKELGL